MKFEFDHKTGMMIPKKDETIYFAKSQGGGLIVDDKKNNIKYIIERDETITKLFGSFDKDKLNFYDIRDARMIADRVLRLFGRNHKYTDYHYFLKGYVVRENIVKSCSDYMTESVWSEIRDRANGEFVRKEDGRIIATIHNEDEIIRLIMSNESLSQGDLVEFDGNKYYTLNDGYIAIINCDGKDTYYAYDEYADVGEPNMKECFTVDESLREFEDFGALKAVMQSQDISVDDFDLIEVDIRNASNSNISATFNYNMGNSIYYVFTDHDEAKDVAIDMEKDLLISSTLTRKEIERFRQFFGNDFFNCDEVEDDIKESYNSYYDDLSEEEAVDELLRLEIIQDTEDYFEVDEDGDTDTTQPKFNYKSYKSDYVDKIVGDISDFVDQYILEYGYDGLDRYIDIPKLAELIVENDGVGSVISAYDGEEHTERIDYTTYYIYRS